VGIFFGFKKTPFSDCPTPNNSSPPGVEPGQDAAGVPGQHHGVAWSPAKWARASPRARVFAASLNPSLYKILYVHFSSGRR